MVESLFGKTFYVSKEQHISQSLRNELGYDVIFFQKI